MKLHNPSFNRLKESQLRPEAIGTIFEMMADLVTTCGSGNQFTLTWQQPGDEFAEDDLLPVITLSLQPAATMLAQPQPTE